ncbi:MAG: helix-turn-helix domain-containing protein [Halobacteriales archaeon]|nr:helix-turn-helix domain-containing protein [Halobacteriales archaeon]
MPPVRPALAERFVERPPVIAPAPQPRAPAPEPALRATLRATPRAAEVAPPPPPRAEPVREPVVPTVPPLLGHDEPAPILAPRVEGGSRRSSLLLRLLGLASGVFGWRRVARGNALEHDARHRLLAHLRERPGQHLRGLARGLGLTVQNANYHLRQLEQVGLVASMRVGRRRCYYPAEGGKATREQALAEGVLASGNRDRILLAGAPSRASTRARWPAASAWRTAR